MVKSRLIRSSPRFRRLLSEMQEESPGWSHAQLTEGIARMIEEDKSRKQRLKNFMYGKGPYQFVWAFVGVAYWWTALGGRVL